MNKITLFFFEIIVSLVVLNGGAHTAFGLSNYCSSNVNTKQLYEKFQVCHNIKNYMVQAQTSKSAMSDFVKFNESFSNITEILKKVFTSIDTGKSSKNETKHLFLDLLRVVKLAKSQSMIEQCLIEICDFFKNCEFPLNIEYKAFENDALTAARIASLLTSYTFNEKLDEKVYLTKANIYSLLRLSIAENENIYDCKIVFLRSPEQERFMFHAHKDLNQKSGRLFSLTMLFLTDKPVFACIVVPC